MLKLQESHIVPKVVRTSVAQDVRQLFHNFSEQYRDLIKTCLEEKTEAEQDQNLSIFLEDNIFDSCFDDISTDYKFYQCCINEFGLVEPIEYLLGHDSRGKKESFQCIPILQILHTILTRGHSRNIVLRTDTRASRGDILSDFHEGSIYKNHPFFSSSEKQLQIQLYTDEFEVLNCLGSKKLKHKISCFYFVRLNIPPKYRSQLRNIHVTILVRHKFVLKYGYESILRPLISDLLKLQVEGVTVNADNEQHIIKGALVSIASDNLSAHSQAGFSTCFSNGRICRHCLCHHETIANHIDEHSCVVRTAAVHKHHLDNPNRNSFVWCDPFPFPW